MLTFQFGKGNGEVSMVFGKRPLIDDCVLGKRNYGRHGSGGVEKAHRVTEH